MMITEFRRLTKHFHELMKLASNSVKIIHYNAENFSIQQRKMQNIEMQPA